MTRSARWKIFIESLRIRARDRRVIPLKLNQPQLRVWEECAPKIDRGEPIRLIILKGRRQGVSTLIEALLMAHIASFDYVNALITAHQKKAAAKIWSMSKLFVTSSPLLSHPQVASLGSNRISIGRSTLDISSAGSPESERGGDLTAWHSCLDPNVPVVLADGAVVPIKDVLPGDSLRTHTGALTRVRHVWSRPAEEVTDRGRMVSLFMWNTGIPLVLTPDHKCWTPNGWVPAGDLKLGDEIGVPIRPLTETRRHLPIRRPVRAGSGRQAWQDDVLPLTRETGFFFGYYLAEGSARRQHQAPHGWCSVGLAGHRDERGYAERAASAIAPWATSWNSKERVGPKTLITAIYGSSLTDLVVQEFGVKDSKRIPDWVWTAPREFCEGIVEGYISGDGSKGTDNRTYFNAQISITSIRPALLVQVRNLLASLGWGWAGLTRRNAETFVDARGWTNRPAWVLHINGRPALHLRRMMGWELPPEGHITRRPRVAQEKFRIDGGTLWARIRLISETVSDRVMDLEVEHADHSFETLQGAVANSEGAFYPYPEVMTATMQSLPDSKHIFSIGVLESTANARVGTGAMFYEEWKRAEEGDSDWVPMFLPFHQFEENRIIGATIEDPDDEEFELRQRFELTDAQLAWRRWKIRNDLQGDVDRFHQEHPATAEESFIQSGLPFFRTHQLLPLERALRPGTRGTIDADGRFTADPKGYLEIYTPPEPGHQYVIGADSSMGIADDERGKSHSRSAAEVIDMETLEQVAEYDAVSAPHVMARHLAGMGRLYQNALIAPEVQSSGGGGGREIIVYLRDLGYWNLHRWRQPDRIRHTDSVLYGWATNMQTRPRMLSRIREVVMERSATIHSRRLFNQLSAFGENDSQRMEALVGHDDLLFAWGIALMSRSENYFKGVENLNPSTFAPPDWGAMGIHVKSPEAPWDRLQRLLAISDREVTPKSFLET